MSRLRPVLIAVVAGLLAAAAALGSAALSGMPGKEVLHLGLLLLPALALTVAVGGLAWARDARARERRVEAQRQDLVTAVSHDLRTPLASLRAMAEAIDEGVVDDAPTLRRYAVEIRRSAESLGTLVDDLFELVQLESEAIAAEARRATVEEVVESALAACRAHAHEKGLRVEAELDGAAKAPCSPRLERVLQNLIQNAEWAHGRVWPDSRTRDALSSFLRFYNRRRPHSAAGGRPPTSRVHQVRRQNN